LILSFSNAFHVIAVFWVRYDQGCRWVKYFVVPREVWFLQAGTELFPQFVTCLRMYRRTYKCGLPHYISIRSHADSPHPFPWYQSVCISLHNCKCECWLSLANIRM
jgi:hypothetical protein